MLIAYDSNVMLIYLPVYFKSCLGFSCFYIHKNLLSDGWQKITIKTCEYDLKNSFYCYCIFFVGSESDSNGLLVITPSTVTAGHHVGLYKVDDVLNLTCIFMNKKKIPDVLLDWVIPSKASNRFVLLSF